MPTLQNCTRCGFVSSQDVCKACTLLEGLDRGLPKLGIGKSSKVKRMIANDDKRKAESRCCKTNCCAVDRTKEKV